MHLGLRDEDDVFVVDKPYVAAVPFPRKLKLCLRYYRFIAACC